MFKFNSISHLAGHTVIRLELDVSGALTDALIDTINSACDCIEDAGTGAALLILMHGKPGDAHAADGEVNVQLVNRWERALRRIERLPAVTISAASGACGDLGVSIMLTTDYRIGSECLQMSLRNRDGGILPGMVLHRLANQVGVSWARRFAVLGMPINAHTGRTLGLVDETSAEPESAANAFIKALCPTVADDLPVRRRLLLDASALSYEEGLGTHLAACDRRLRAARQPAMANAPAQDRAAAEHTN
jgi:isomerase DpgB